MTANEKVIISAAGGILGSIIDMLLGGWSFHVTALIILMCLDFSMGIAVAVFWNNSKKTNSGKLSSKECWKGIIKKIGTLFIVAAAYQIDKLLGIDYIKNAVIIGFCVSEIISISENADRMGILPETVRNIIGKGIELLNKNGKDN